MASIASIASVASVAKDEADAGRERLRGREGSGDRSRLNVRGWKAGRSLGD